MRITIETESYNERRYGKPYIALIDFSDSRGAPTWGDWIGQPGTSGLLELTCEPGDIVMRGQKDFRKSRNSAPDYYQVQASGSVPLLLGMSKAEAYKTYRAAGAPENPLAKYTDDQIHAEAIRRGLASH